jgi:hypothetical protein
MTSMPKLLVVAAFAAAVTVAPRVHADPTAADLLVARQLANEGIELAQKGDCDGALLKLERAEAIHHAPTILLHIGECQQRLGHYVEALSAFDRVAREQLGPTPPRAFVTAQQRAATLVDQVRPKVGNLRIDTSGSRTGVVFRLDGGELKEATLGLERPINPGSHVLEAVTPDGRRVRRAVDVSEGATELITLELPEATVAPVAAAGGPVPPAPGKPADSKMRTLGWGLAAGGAVGLVASAVFAGLTLSTKSSLDGACVNKTCPPSAQGDYDSANTTATVSGIALGVGVVALGAGVFILLTQKPDRVGGVPAWVKVASAGKFSF